MSSSRTESFCSDFTSSTKVEMETNSTDGTDTDRPNRRFSLAGDYVTLRVENELFRVPSFVLGKHSPKFQRLLDTDLSSSSHDGVIELKDLEALDFERMLSLLLTSVLDPCDLQTFDEWASVLKVAHKWDFPVARSLAIKELEKTAISVDKVVLGHQYEIPEWVLYGYVELIIQKQPLTKIEGSKLGLDDILELGELREWWHKTFPPGFLKRAAVAEVKRQVSKSPPANAGRVLKASQFRDNVQPDGIVSFGDFGDDPTFMNNRISTLPGNINKFVWKPRR